MKSRKNEKEDLLGFKRMGRFEYFYTLLPLAIISSVLDFFDVFDKYPVLTMIVLVVIIILWIVSGIKRFHDLDMSGWNCLRFLIPIYNIVIGLKLLFRKGTNGANTYGEDPLIQNSEIKIAETKITKERNQSLDVSIESKWEWKAWEISTMFFAICGIFSFVLLIIVLPDSSSVSTPPVPISEDVPAVYNYREPNKKEQVPSTPALDNYKKSSEDSRTETGSTESETAIDLKTDDKTQIAIDEILATWNLAIEFPSESWVFTGKNESKPGATVFEFYRDAVVDTKDKPINPYIGFIFENVDAKTDFVNFYINKKKQMPLEIENSLSNIESYPISKYGTGSTGTHTLDEEHTVVIFYAIYKTAGLTIVMDSTSDVFSQVEKEFYDTLKSADFFQGSGQ